MYKRGLQCLGETLGASSELSALVQGAHCNGKHTPLQPLSPFSPVTAASVKEMGLARAKQKRLLTDPSVLVLLLTQFSMVPSEAKVHRLSFALKPPKRWQISCPCCSQEPFSPFVWTLTSNLRDRQQTLAVWPCVPDFPGTCWRAERKPGCGLLALCRIQMHEFQYRLFLLGLCV